MINLPTRFQNILDLFFTTNPTLVNKISTIPGISDRDAIICAEVNIKPKSWKQMPHEIPIYKKADWGQLKQIMVDYYQDQLTRDPYAQDVQPLWDSFIDTLG